VRLWFTVRNADFERAEEVYNLILPIAQDAARYTGTDFQEQFIRAFEQLLGAPKEDQSTIMKELAIRCLGRAN